jgi:hypothetical protein
MRGSAGWARGGEGQPTQPKIKQRVPDRALGSPNKRRQPFLDTRSIISLSPPSATHDDGIALCVRALNRLPAYFQIRGDCRSRGARDRACARLRLLYRATRAGSEGLADSCGRSAGAGGGAAHCLHCSHLANNGIGCSPGGVDGLTERRFFRNSLEQCGTIASGLLLGRVLTTFGVNDVNDKRGRAITRTVSLEKQFARLGTMLIIVTLLTFFSGESAQICKWL